MGHPTETAPVSSAATLGADATSHALRRYYAFHARIYDWTRWTFLFGRQRLVDEIAARLQPRDILEIGCGTGVNLARLARRFPAARLTGWDGSPDMLARARRRLTAFGERCRLHSGFYPPGSRSRPQPDLIVVSYCLSMVNPGWEALIDTVAEEVASGGLLAVVDFHGSSLAWFRRWMGVNHVRLDRHLWPRLHSVCRPLLAEALPAWGGAWQYFLFLGRPLAA